MRYTRWIVLGIGGLVATATGVGALTGTSPTRTIVNLVAVVDELGNVLFGSKPGRVEVTNFPSQPGSGEIFDFTIPFANPGAGSFVVATVPGDRALVLTDIDGAYGCYNGCLRCALSDSTGERLVWEGGDPSPMPHRSYTTGIRFAPSEVVTWTEVCGGIVHGPITFMGRLVPVPGQ